MTPLRDGAKRIMNANMPEEFANESTRIIHGDTLEVLHTIANKSVDLIFADPPYNIGKRFGDNPDIWPSDQAYFACCKAWLKQCLDKLKPHGSIYLMSSTQAMPHLDIWLRDEVNILSRIVWTYDSSGVQARRYYGSLYEPILFAVKDRKQYTFNAEAIEVEARTGAVRQLIDYRKPIPAPYSPKKIPGNVWTFPRVRYRMAEYEDHPAQKPEALLQRIILASSNPGDVVLDPFAGTFTTCAVASRLGRRSIGVEAHRAYVATGLRRLNIAQELDGAPLCAIEKSTNRRTARPG